MSNTIRAKMRCTQSHSAHGQHTVELQAVYSSDPAHENARFWAATPSGAVQLSVLRPEIARHFVAGREYYVDFTPASVPPAEKHSQVDAKEQA